MNLRKNLASYIALNNYVSAYRDNFGYKEVEYVEKKSDELSKIVTSWKPNTGKNLHIYGSFIRTSTSGSVRNLILGCYTNQAVGDVSANSAVALNIEIGGVSPQQCFRLYSKCSAKTSGVGSQVINQTITTGVNVDFDIITDGTTGAFTEKILMNNVEYSYDGELQKNSSDVFLRETCSLPMCIFNDYRTTDAFKPYSFRLGKITAEEDGIKVLDLVPVVRLSDNAVGFFDNVTGEFLGNSGEGTLVAGPDVDRNSVEFGNRLELKDAVNKPFESLSAYGYTEQLSEEYLDTVTAKGKCEIKKEYQTLVANGGTKQSQRTLQAKGKCGFVCVPSEYIQVESITTDGTSYINTGIEYTNYTGFDLDFSMTNSSNKILGAYNGSMNFYLEGSGTLTCGSETSSNTINSSDTNRQRASLINQKVTKSNGTTETITQPIVGGYAQNIYLGGINNNGSFADGKSITIYAVRLYVKDKVVFDGVPARKELTYGLYDTISGKFITNAGSGTITGGKEVFDLLPKEYTRVEYIENYWEGDQNTIATKQAPYIDTGVVIGNNDTFVFEITTKVVSGSFYLMQSRESAISTAGYNSTITGISGSGTGDTVYSLAGDSSGTASKIPSSTPTALIRNTTDNVLYTARFVQKCDIGSNKLYITRLDTDTTYSYSKTYDQSILTRATTSVCIFGTNASDSGGKCNRVVAGCRVFDATIWKNGELVINYIPAVRNSDNVVGFYDTVSGNFIVNANTTGSGYFIAGNAIIDNTIPTSPKEIRCNNGVIEKDATSANKYKITPTVKETLVDFPDTEYTVLDYIESTGTQYIDTGFVYSENTKILWDVQLTASLPLANPNSCGIGYLYNNNYGRIGFSWNNPSWGSKLYFYKAGTYGNSYPNDMGTMLPTIDNDNNRHTFIEDAPNYKVYVDGVEYTFDNSVGTINNSENATVPLFVWYALKTQTQYGYSYYANMRLYACKIWDNGTLVRDFEPRRRNSDGVIGLYDKVNDVFYTNAGTGEFKSDYSKFNNITCENLLSIPNTEYFDTQDILQGIKTKRIGVKVFDGTEPDSDFDVKTNWYEYVITPNLPVQFHSSSDVRTVLCTHFDGTYVESPNHVYSTSSYGNQALTFRVTSTYATLADFKSFLASEYAAGRPVIVLYPIYHVGSQETTHVSKPETLPENNVTVVKGALQDLELNKYEELEYITATGTQWIDTGILAASDIKAEVKFKPTTNDSTYSVLGGRDGERVNTFTIFTRVSGGTIRLDYGNNQSPVSQTQSVSTENWNFITKDGANNYFNGSAISNNSAETFASTTNNIYLFTLNNNGTVSTYPFIGSIAYCKLYKNGVMVRNFIPAKRKSDNEVGMYDKVSGQFFTNIGTGTFTAGTSKTSWVGNPNNPADIWTNNGIIYTLPSEYTALEYLQTSGQTTINTNYYPKVDSTKIVTKVDFLGTGDNKIFTSGTYEQDLYQLQRLDSTHNNEIRAYYFSTAGSGDFNSTSSYTTSNNPVYVEFDKHTLNINGSAISSFDTKNTSSSSPLYIFQNDGSTTNMNMYYFGIYENGALVHYYVPVKRNSDNVVGMYNLVSKTFSTNTGSGSFTAGTTVTSPVYYISGTQEQIEVEGNNLIDFDISVMAQGYYNNTGNCWRIPTNWSYAVSAPIEVIPGKTYRYSFTKQIAHDTSDNCVIGYSTLTTAQNDIVDQSATQGTKLVVCPSSDTTFGKQYGDYSYDITIPSGINYVRVTSIFENMNGPDNLYCETSTSDKNTNFRRVDISRPENLLSISETYTDTQYIKEGKKYAKCGIKVLDPDSITGNKLKIYNASLYIKEQATDCAIELNLAQMNYKNAVGYCTHLKLSQNDIWSRVNDYPNTFSINNSNGTSNQFHMCFANSLTGIDYQYVTTLSTPDAKIEYAKGKIRDYIVAQYNAGTPIIIVYPLATTEEINTPAIDLQKNPISVEVVKASLESESLPLIYDEVFDTSDPTPTEPKDIWCNNGVINGLYSELDYITATGTQYIQTTISGPARWVGAGQGTSDSSGSKVIVSAQATTGGTIQGAVIWIGSRLGSTDADKYWTLGGSVSTGLSTSTVPTLDYAEYDVSFNNGALTGKVNDFTFDTVNNQWDIGVWRIGTSFTNNTGNPNYYFIGNIYRQKAYQNNVLVGDFIPAKRNSDNVVGMYDVVSGTFLTNAGSGTFTAGNIKNYFVVGTVEKLVDNVGNEAQCELLLKSANGDAFEDTQEIISGNVTRNCAIKVFDGSENESWKESSGWGGTNTIVYYLTDSNIKHDSSLYSSTITLCTHYKSYSRDYLNTNDVEGSGISGLTTNTAFTFRVSRTDFPDVTAWKTWLAAQYAAGTPVMMVYPLKTATSETVSKQILRKDPVTVQEASLEDLVVDTTKSIHTTPNPDFPLSIQNNNGIVSTLSKANWKIITNPTSATDQGAWITNKTGTPSGIIWSVANDPSTSVVIPLTIGHNYTLSIDNVSEGIGTTFKYGQSAVDTPGARPTASSGWVFLSTPSSASSSTDPRGKTVTFTATQPYFVVQISYLSGNYMKYISAMHMVDNTINNITPEQLVYTGKNLNDTSTDTTGSYINQNGEIISDITATTSSYSDLIPVIPGHTYTWSGICGNSGQRNNKRVHGYLDDAWTTQIVGSTTNPPVTVDFPANQPFCITFTVPLGVNNIRISHWTTDTYTQVEEGARPTHYESYIQTKLPVDDLYSVSSDYTDVKNIITGNVTRKCGVLVFTGEENWSWAASASANAPARLYISDIAYVPSSTVAPIVCTHFMTEAWDNISPSTKTNPYIVTNATNNPAVKMFAFTIAWNPDITDVETWKSYLKKKYQEGDPIIVIYPIATPTTETSIANQLSTNTSTNTVERISSTTNNLGISADYKKLK